MSLILCQQNTFTEQFDMVTDNGSMNGSIHETMCLLVVRSISTVLRFDSVASRLDAVVLQLDSVVLLTYLCFLNFIALCTSGPP